MPIRYLAFAALAAFASAQQDPAHSSDTAQGKTAPRPPGALVIPAPASAPARAAGGQAQAHDGFDRVLRRIAELAQARDEELTLVVEEAAVTFPDAWERLRLASRTADLDVLKGLIRVLAMRPGEETASDLRHLLRNRSLKGLTRKTLEALVIAAGRGGKAALLDELRNRESAVRLHATELVAKLLGPEDVPFLIELAEERNLELRRTAMMLLGHVPAPESRARLLKALSEALGGVSAAAGKALAAHGLEAAPDLALRLRARAIDQGFGHAALALTAIEDRTGKELLTADMVPYLAAELRGRDQFNRSACAVALANLAFRDIASVAEKDVMDALVGVVAPKAHFADYGSCLDPAMTKLALLSGRRGASRPDAWEAWWSGARETFRGARLGVDLDGEAGGRARLSLEDPGSRLEVIGPDAAPSAPGEGKGLRVSVRLDREGFAALVAELRAAGFMTTDAKKAEAESISLPAERSLTLALDGRSAVLSAPRSDTPWFDPLARAVQACVDAQRWQLFRDPVAAKDESAWWATEWLFFKEHPVTSAEGRARLVDLIVASLENLPPALQDRGVAHLMEIGDLAAILTEAHGGRLNAVAAKGSLSDARTRRFLEISILCRSEANWQGVLELVASRWEAGGRETLPRLFALQGAERVIASLRDTRPLVRGSAAEELAGVRDPKAVEGVLALLSDPDAGVRRSAVFAAGRQRSQGAKPKLLEMAAGEDGTVRREAYVALGQIGGADAFKAILRGTTVEEPRDRMAAVRGLAALEGPDAAAAAEVLVSIFVTHQKTTIGQLAADALRDRNHLAVRYELRRRLETADQDLRRAVIFLLAEGMDPLVVPDLTSMLELGVSPSQCTLHLTAITGIDYGERADKVALWRVWWERNKDKSLGQWLIEALAVRKHAVPLKPESLTPGAGLAAVTELARLVEEAPDWYIRALACSVLREVTGKDFGVVRRDDSPARLSALAERYRGLLVVSGGR